MSYNSSQYWVNQNGENVGPYSLDEIRLLEKSGDLDIENPACLVGEEEWLSVGELLGNGSPADPEVGTNGGRKIIMAKKQECL